MRPTFAAGDLVVVTSKPSRDVEVGEVVAYAVPVGGHQVETHRVVRVLRRSSAPIVVIRGDANAAADPWRAKLHGRVLWTYRFRVPLADRRSRCCGRAGCY